MSALRDDLVVSSVADLDAALFVARRQGRRVGLVPTLGGLHDGHAANVRKARSENDLVVVSIFLNPLQFEDPSDLVRYPAELPADARTATGAGADLVFAPAASELYPNGAPEVTVDPGGAGEVLEGASRPGHFRGVATVVAKLLSIVRPATAYFGEKDYQQLVIVRRLVEDLSLPVAVVSCPTVRDVDGLALSSRNAFLTVDERRDATSLHRALVVASDAISRGETEVRAVIDVMRRVVAEAPRVTVDYAHVVREGSLDDVESVNGDVRILIAARVGTVRLIDNVLARYTGSSR
jgi:pantoate--beta-alanine ligase